MTQDHVNQAPRPRYSPEINDYLTEISDIQARITVSIRRLMEAIGSAVTDLPPRGIGKYINKLSTRENDYSFLVAFVSYSGQLSDQKSED